MTLLRRFLIAFLIVTAWHLPLRAEEAQRVILVLDASGSMWGQIGGKTKMEIAKQVVGKVIGAWKPSDELGLVAYGHRKKGSCDDIEVLLAPGPLDAESYMDAVNSLNPVGKTPMTQAVRMAAESLKFTEQKATVILVSDGIETCDPDPCAVAGELEKLGVGLTVHTVGFGLDDKGAVAQLQCLAEKTGGISVLAENADELEEALAKTVEATAETPPEPEVLEFNITGHVVMAAGVELPPDFDSPTWEFHTSVNGEKGEWVKTAYGADLKTSIETAGDYIARISDDAAVIEIPFTLAEGKAVIHNVSLEAGIVRLGAKLDETTKLEDKGAAWELLDSSGKWIATKYGADASFLANAGSYKVRLALGAAKAEQDITVAAGKIEDVTVMLGAGIIQAVAVFTPGGPAVADSAAIELRKGEAALDDSHEWITTTYGSATQFNVPAGNYLVVVNQDYATGSAAVDVKAGGVSKVEVALNAGFLAVAGPPSSTIEVFAGEKDISGGRKHIATEYNGALNKAFNAGSYHVVAKDDEGKAIGEKDFEVKPGQRTEGAIP